MVGIERLRYLIEDRDANGNLRRYIRVPGQKKVRVPDHLEKGTEEFALFYWNIRRGAAPVTSKAKPGTFRWLVEKYYASQEFADLNEEYTAVERKRHLDPLVAKVGELPAVIPTRSIREAIGPKVRKQSASRKFIAALRHLYAFGLAHEHVTRDPTAGIKVKKPKTDGFKTWPVEYCLRYEEYWPLGTQQRTAYAIALYLGARRSDAVRIGKRQEELGGRQVRYTQHKGREKRGVEVVHPIVPPLREALDAWQGKGFTWLETSYGRPRSDKGFGNDFAEWCHEAGVPKGYTYHGLRKALAARLAEGGYSTNEINAVLGDKTLQQAEVYTRAAEKKLMATKALTGLFGAQKVPDVRGRDKKAKKS